MREIKFRGWNKTKNRMDFFSGIFNRHPYTEMSTFQQYESSPKYHEFEIMEFTGLKDQNGKEIYEGDIWEREGYLGEVAFEYSGWSFKKLPKAHYYQYPNFWSNAESGNIIGNIYENPELLTKEAQNGKQMPEGGV